MGPRSSEGRSGRGVVGHVAVLGAPEQIVDLLDVSHEVLGVVETELDLAVGALLGGLPEEVVKVVRTRDEEWLYDIPGTGPCRVLKSIMA